MATIHHAEGPGVGLAEALGADDSLRSELTGDVHLVSLDGESFYTFPGRPEASNYQAIREMVEEGGTRLPAYSRGIVRRAMGRIEEIEVQV
jgi:hypothetical protein